MCVQGICERFVKLPQRYEKQPNIAPLTRFTITPSGVTKTHGAADVGRLGPDRTLYQYYLIGLRVTQKSLCVAHDFNTIHRKEG
jgi:hypothetical protein